jgi:hypothetical protein
MEGAVLLLYVRNVQLSQETGAPIRRYMVSTFRLEWGACARRQPKGLIGPAQLAQESSRTSVRKKSTGSAEAGAARGSKCRTEFNSVTCRGGIPVI